MSQSQPMPSETMPDLALSVLSARYFILAVGSLAVVGLLVPMGAEWLSLASAGLVGVSPLAFLISRR